MHVEVTDCSGPTAPALRGGIGERLLSNPRARDRYLIHLSTVRRATLMLLANREEFPDTLVAELKAYKVTLDAL